LFNKQQVLFGEKYYTFRQTKKMLMKFITHDGCTIKAFSSLPLLFCLIILFKIILP